MKKMANGEWRMANGEWQNLYGVFPQTIR